MNFISNKLLVRGVGVYLALMSTQVFAQVTVENAWAQATTPSQTVTGVFLTVQSNKAAALVGAESAVAGAVEFHEMKMNGESMSMQAVKRVALPAGKAVELKPGGYHIMLIDLKRKPLKVGETLPLKLKIENADGKVEVADVQVEVRKIGSANKKAMDHSQHMHH